LATAFKWPLIGKVFMRRFANKQSHFMNPNKEYHDLDPDCIRQQFKMHIFQLQPSSVKTALGLSVEL